MIILVFIYSSYSTNLYRMPHIWTLRAKYWRHRKLWTGGTAQEAIIPCGKGQSRKVWVCLMWSVRSDLQPQWDSRSAHHNRASPACPSLLQFGLSRGPPCSCFRTMNSKREAGVKVKYHDCCNVRSLRHMCFRCMRSSLATVTAASTYGSQSRGASARWPLWTRGTTVERGCKPEKWGKAKQGSQGAAASRVLVCQPELALPTGLLSEIVFSCTFRESWVHGKLWEDLLPAAVCHLHLLIFGSFASPCSCQEKAV